MITDDRRRHPAPAELRSSGHAFERRRPGRVAIENEHLIRLLRQPDAIHDAAQPPAPLNLPQARGGLGNLLLLVMLAALFWAVMAAAIWMS